MKNTYLLLSVCLSSLMNQLTGLAESQAAPLGANSSQAKLRQACQSTLELAPSLQGTKLLLAQNSPHNPMPGPEATKSLPRCTALVIENYRLRQQGNYQEALKSLQEAAKLAQTDPEKILVFNAFGGLYMQTQNDSEAESYFRKALALLEKTEKADSLKMATILDNLSVVCSGGKKYAEAESLNTRAIEIYRKNKTAPNAVIDLITVLGNRGYILSCQKKDTESKKAYEEAVSLCRSENNIPPTLYATMLDNLGSAYFLEGDFKGSEQARVDALALFESSQGQYHPETIKARRNLAAVYLKEGRTQEAYELLKSCVDALKKLGSVNRNLLTGCLSDYVYVQKLLADEKAKTSGATAGGQKAPESAKTAEDEKSKN